MSLLDRASLPIEIGDFGAHTNDLLFRCRLGSPCLQGIRSVELVPSLGPQINIGDISHVVVVILVVIFQVCHVTDKINVPYHAVRVKTGLEEVIKLLSVAIELCNIFKK